MKEFEKWLEKLDYKKIEHQTSNIDDACEDTKNLILSKYQELHKDKIVLMLDEPIDIQKYQTTVEILKNRNSAIKINHKIGSRNIANEELQECAMAIDYVANTIQNLLNTLKQALEVKE